MTDSMLFGAGSATTENGAVPDLAALAQTAREQAEERARKPFPVHGIDELLALKDPDWLLTDILPETGFAVLYGPPGVGKSFVALDWSLTIAAGLDWFGRAVKPGSVVYVAGEGVSGIKRRVQAWLATHPGDPRGRFFMVPEAPNLLDPEHTTRLAATLGQVRDKTGQPAALLVVDTMARSLVGGDENSAKDVGQFIANVDALARPQAALVLHHTQKASAVERGSSSLRGAADVMVSVTPAKNDRTRFTLSSEKAKDSEPFEDVRLLMRPVGQSIALVRDITPPKQDPTDHVKDRVLGVIAQADEPLSLRSVRAKVKGSNDRIKEAIETLIFEEHIEKFEGGFRPCPARSGTFGTPPTSDPQEATVPRPGTPRRGPAGGTPPEPPIESFSQTVPLTVPDGSGEVWPCEQHDRFWTTGSGLVCATCHPPVPGSTPMWVERPDEDADWEAGL